VPGLEVLEERCLLTVFGADDRVFVTQPDQYPYSAIGRFRITFPDGASFLGTGALIDADHVLTAGHVVYEKDHGGFATSLVFTPGTTEGSAPFGSANATLMRTNQAWVDSADYRYDYAVVTLNKDLGTETGSFGVEAPTDAALRQGILFNSAGYPGDLSYAATDMYRIQGGIDSYTPTNFFYTGTLDVYGGQSGSPIWRTDGAGNRYIDGIVTAETNQTNFGVRITSGFLTQLESWLQADQVRSTATQGGSFSAADPTAPPPANALPEEMAPPVEPPGSTPTPTPMPTPTAPDGQAPAATEGTGAAATTPSAAPVSGDVTQSVQVSVGGVRRSRGGRVVETLVLRNAGGQDIQGPLNLVLAGLDRRLRLVNASGRTTKQSPGSPFVTAAVPGDGLLAPGDEVTVSLVFSNPRHRSIPTTTQVFAGPGDV
jgi:V8-like Glu-specific endopeptidase